MAKSKSYDECECCSEPFGHDAIMHWTGSPFSKRSTVTLCTYCIHAIQPIVQEHNGARIQIIGTNSGDVNSLEDMISDGFEAKRSKISIQKVGAAMNLDADHIKIKTKPAACAPKLSSKGARQKRS